LFHTTQIAVSNFLLKEAVMSSFDLYQTITDQIVAMLETGVVPWRSPILGCTSAGHPKNLNTGKGYRGVNVFLLAFTSFAKGYGSSYWLTFNQAKERGGSVRKGEKSSMVVFWKQYETTDKDTGQPTKIPVLRYLCGRQDYVDALFSLKCRVAFVATI
jgi:antirestriction protein ArdC